MARILIVDDSLVARKALEKIVTAKGHLVVGEAANGAEAFTEYKKLKPDLVTLDLAMPGCDGMQALSDILSVFSDARIIVVSARQDREVILEALERGAKHFIAKPFSPEKIETVFSNVLQQNFDNEKRLALLKSLKIVRSVESKEPARVLIVDDSAVARKSLREIINDLGHTVVGEAENGSRAFVEYTRLKPDVVTMDLTMQGLGGAEATSKIIAADPRARIIVISAMEARLAIIDALERGARHFIIKPIKSDKIAAALFNVLRQDFDQNEHMERVRKLKDMIAAEQIAVNKMVLPPYRISHDGNKLIHVMISDSITPNSFQSLALEMEEYLDCSLRVLFDFGAMLHLEESLVLSFGGLIKKVEDNNGLVKAIANSERFVKSVSELESEQFNYLAEIVRVY